MNQPKAQAMPSLPNWTALSITTPNQYKIVECMWEGAASERKVPLFTDDQMRAYGQAYAQWQATRQAAPSDMHAAVMNIRCLTPTGFSEAEKSAYREGCKTTRHAAADLVAGAAQVCQHESGCCGACSACNPIPAVQSAVAVSDAMTLLAELRALGLSVAIHNDYRLNGEDHTFWLLVRADGMSYKGEGKTDHEALTRVAMAVAHQPEQKQ